ncbi:MAG: hypothetical protein QM757_11940 [Paludibaculum sp.]
MDFPPNAGGGDPADERIKRAVRRIPVDPLLQAKVRASVEQARRRNRLQLALLWTGLAAAPALLLWMFGPLSGAADPPQLAAGQHAACAVAHLLPVEPWAEGHGGLRSYVERQMPGDFRLLDMHRCRQEGRTYDHLVLGLEGERISLLVAELWPEERLGLDWETPSPRGRYQVSSAPSGHRAVFLVSELPFRVHENLARRLDPRAVQEALDAFVRPFPGIGCTPPREAASLNRFYFWSHWAALNR